MCLTIRHLLEIEWQYGIVVKSMGVQPVTGTVPGLLKKQIFIFQTLDAGKSKIKAPEDLASGDSPFPDS